MSIYYVKSVKFDKENGKIFVTAADSSVVRGATSGVNMLQKFPTSKKNASSSG